MNIRLLALSLTTLLFSTGIQSSFARNPYHYRSTQTNEALFGMTLCLAAGTGIMLWALSKIFSSPSDQTLLNDTAQSLKIIKSTYAHENELIQYYGNNTQNFDIAFKKHIIKTAKNRPSSWWYYNLEKYRFIYYLTLLNKDIETLEKNIKTLKKRINKLGDQAHFSTINQEMRQQLKQLRQEQLQWLTLLKDLGAHVELSAEYRADVKDKKKNDRLHQERLDKDRRAEQLNKHLASIENRL